MKFYKNIPVLFLLFGFLNLKAQYTTHPMITIGYHYQNQSFGEVGGKILFLKEDNIAFRIGGSALLGAANGKFAIMPKIQGDLLLNLRKNVDVAHAYYYMIGAEATTKYVAPYAGISILGIVDFRAGYAFSFVGQNLHGKRLHGINFGFVINLPTSVLKK
jgi:hypothetical protein